MPESIHQSSKPRMRRPSLERSLKLLLESKASSASIRAELFGPAAEGWHDIQSAAKPLGLSQDQLLALIIRHAYPAVLKAIERELDSNHTERYDPAPQQG